MTNHSQQAEKVKDRDSSRKIWPCPRSMSWQEIARSILGMLERTRTIANIAVSAKSMQTGLTNSSISETLAWMTSVSNLSKSILTLTMLSRCVFQLSSRKVSIVWHLPTKSTKISKCSKIPVFYALRTEWRHLKISRSTLNKYPNRLAKPVFSTKSLDNATLEKVPSSKEVSSRV